VKDKSKSSRFQKLRTSLPKYLQWFIPGMGVKRWLVVVLAGITLLGIGFAVLVLDVYRTAPNAWWLPVLSVLSLRFLYRPLRALIFGGLGIGLVTFGIWRLNRALLAPFTRPGQPVLDAVASHRRRKRGPQIVVIGGGTGQSVLLRGLKDYSHHITAVVTVADDGGSSGRLRESLGILPPGDIRNCLAALSHDEALLTQLFQYRFSDELDGLQGHSFGNLFISALSDITGSFEEAVAESGRVLSAFGQVLPATLRNVRLVADVDLPFRDGAVRVEGESRIPEMDGEIRHVWLEPENPPAYPQVVQSILNAELIVVGPGSLYTSILPNLLVSDITEALRASQALRMFVCNVATQPGETDGYTCGDHLKAIETHAGQGLFDLVVCNSQHTNKLPVSLQWVKVESGLENNYAIYQADLVDKEFPWRHDAGKLSQAIIDLYTERTGPLVESL